MVDRHYIIGVDIGGTNTDGVLVDQRGSVVTSIKVATTFPVAAGFRAVINQLLQQPTINAEAIDTIVVGTTHAINALLQANDLHKIGVIRLAGHRPTSLPACYGWPTSLKQALYSGEKSVGGGMECHGAAITPLSHQEIRQAALELYEKGAEGFAVVGVFSPLYPEQEMIAAAIIREIFGPDIPLTLSHTLGGIGIVERENGAIVNSALKKTLAHGFRELTTIAMECGIRAPLYLTQNNGTRLPLARAIEEPLLTLSAGATNSFVGAAKLTGISEAVVADIGGTSTDVGILRHGFPRRSLAACRIGGIALHGALPDLLSIALGGGSHVHEREGKVTIGPTSVGSALLELSRSFGGPHLTMTDLAIAAGTLPFTHAKPVIEREWAENVLHQAFGLIQGLQKRMAGNHQELPLILVGGGAGLFSPHHLPKGVILPDHHAIANGYGAALAEVSSSCDRIVSLSQREKVLDDMKNELVAAVIDQGGQSVRIIDQQIIPFHYMAGDRARVIMTAAGRV